MREGGAVLECVVNVSEGRDESVLAALREAAGPSLLDVHTDPHHHRSVITLAGPDVEEAARRLATEAVARIDLNHHEGAHPRLGAVDVVPFAPLAGSSDADVILARDTFAAWAGTEQKVPCFLYGPERTLPDIRRDAFRSLAPDTGPAEPHPTAGATSVGARHVLVAFNLWLSDGATVEVARQIAAGVRNPALLALGLDVGGRAQVSCNLVDPQAVGPGAAYVAVSIQAKDAGVKVVGAELVGLLPATVLTGVARSRWEALDLDPSKTIEARLEQAGL